MSEKELIKQIQELPTDAQREATDFVEFLYNRYVARSKSDKKIRKSISQSSFRGIWKDRKDMQDSTQWVRNIRKSRWTR
ncbi:MAG: DUF2281 domain-containing protein [Balneolales bacterium]